MTTQLPTITATYRHAIPGELADGQIVDIRPGPGPTDVHVIFKPSEATKRLLAEITRQQASQMENGHWRQLPITDENRCHPLRILFAFWQIRPPEDLPDGEICLSLELPGHSLWLIREGEATPRLIDEITWVLTRLVRTEIWIQRGEHDDEPE